MIKKVKIASIISLLVVLLLTACGTSGGNSSNRDPEFVIGITQIVAHPSLDAATAGFKKAFEDAGIDVEFDEQNAQGDQNNALTIANNFVGNGVDLIFANATPSAQSALNATKEIPIVFTSVTDPVGAGLIDSFDSLGGNVTGTSDMYPNAIPNTIDFIVDDFGAKKFGTIYNTGEQNSVVQVEEMRAKAKEKGVEVIERSVSTTNDVKSAAESLIGVVDVIYIITDNTVVSALDVVIQTAYDNDIPLFAGEADSVEKGAFAAFGISYEAIGYEAGQMAIEILKNGKNPSEIPAKYPSEIELIINKKAAEEMGIEIKKEWEEIAKFID